jgi:hypothetical protein
MWIDIIMGRVAQITARTGRPGWKRNRECDREPRVAGRRQSVAHDAEHASDVGDEIRGYVPRVRTADRARGVHFSLRRGVLAHRMRLLEAGRGEALAMTGRPSDLVLAAAERVVLARERFENLDAKMRDAQLAWEKATGIDAPKIEREIFILEKTRTRADELLHEALLDVFEASEKASGREPWRESEKNIEQLLLGSMPRGPFDFARAFPHPHGEMAVIVGDETIEEGSAAE